CILYNARIRKSMEQVNERQIVRFSNMPQPVQVQLELPLAAIGNILRSRNEPGKKVRAFLPAGSANCSQAYWTKPGVNLLGLPAYAVACRQIGMGFYLQVGEPQAFKELSSRLCLDIK